MWLREHRIFLFIKGYVMKLSEMAENLGIDEEDIRELLQLYMDTTKDDLTQLNEAIKANDINKAHEKSHSIKGASGNLTLTELYEIARDFDDNIRKNNLEGIESKIEMFTIKFNALIKELE